MFERSHHQRIEKILHAFNCDLLSQTRCYFGGGTAIVLSLAEYRESLAIDFLCASNEGYRLLRNTISQTASGHCLKRQSSTFVKCGQTGMESVQFLKLMEPCQSRDSQGGPD